MTARVNVARTGPWVPIVLFLAVLVGGCGTYIGDDCGNDRDCPTGAYCDRVMPGGYCTIEACRPGDCPGGSVCVRFANDESYCMAKCKKDGDCRDGYSCITDVGEDPFCSVRVQ